MKKIVFGAALSLLMVLPAMAAVTVTSGPTLLVTSAITTKASSAPIAVFTFTATQSAGETLSSVTVKLMNAGTSVATGTDFASAVVYRDNGNGTFDSATDLVAGTQATVNVGSDTVVTTAVNNSIDVAGTKFFVTVATGATWSGTAPADSVTATFIANGIVTSTNSPITSAVTTSTITADTVAPQLTSASAQNTGGTNAKEAGDSIKLTFGEATNKPTITSANIATALVLSNGHSFLDGAGALGGATWNGDGTMLTITLSAGTSIPTVAIGDTVTVSGTLITDVAGNVATGVQTIAGRFDGSPTGTTDGVCVNGLKNGRLYRLVNTTTPTYLAAGCRLKAFKGEALEHAKGKKFQNVITIDSIDGLVRDNQGKNNNDDDGEDDEDGDENESSNFGRKVKEIRNLDLERRAIRLYARLFRHVPFTSEEWQVMNYLAYGGEISGRDLAAERKALGAFLRQFGHFPQNAEEWRALHALAYGS